MEKRKTKVQIEKGKKVQLKRERKVQMEKGKKSPNINGTEKSIQKLEKVNWY